MTDFLSSQVNTEGQNVDLIQDVGGSLLQGMSNSLSASAPRASSNAEKLDENDQAEDEDSVEEDRKQARTRKNSEFFYGNVLAFLIDEDMERQKFGR